MIIKNTLGLTVTKEIPLSIRYALRLVTTVIFNYDGYLLIGQYLILVRYFRYTFNLTAFLLIIEPLLILSA